MEATTSQQQEEAFVGEMVQLEEPLEGLAVDDSKVTAAVEELSSWRGTC